MFYNNAYETSSGDSTGEMIKKGVDSKGELLDFNTAQNVKSKVKNSGLPGDIIDINSATTAQFESLPGIRKKTAEVLIEYRKRKGKFKKIEDMLNVKGIGKVKLERIRKFIVVK